MKWICRFWLSESTVVLSIATFSAGLALMYGKIDPDYYEDPYLHDPRLLDLVSRIKCLPSDEADKPELANLCELEVVLRSGVRKTVRVNITADISRTR